MGIAKLYGNSLLSTLNARGGWGNGSMDGSGNATGGTSVPVSVQTPRSHEHRLSVPSWNHRGSGRIEYEENSFEMKGSSKSRARESTDIERDGYSAHEIRHGGDRPLNSEVQLELPTKVCTPSRDDLSLNSSGLGHLQ
ncbi:hypothetical protein FRC11_001235 [Ceratobasidium sp. 423]|nr:hypothetical protein FRC11_001235 [Ceratobasidium sp. 423]